MDGADTVDEARPCRKVVRGKPKRWLNISYWLRDNESGRYVGGFGICSVGFGTRCI
jgi:hypothetical protein